MTQSEHRKYLASEWWLQRRKSFLEIHDHCNRCGVDREEARLLYDQDLNVHHKNYQNKGSEKDEDLEALCRRCHEIESKNESGLPEWIPNHPIFVVSDRWPPKDGRSVWNAQCPTCGWDMIHFAKEPCFIHEDHDLPHLLIFLTCESGHQWEIKFHFDHGSMYIYPQAVKTLEHDEYPVLR